MIYFLFDANLIFLMLHPNKGGSRGRMSSSLHNSLRGILVRMVGPRVRRVGSLDGLLHDTLVPAPFEVFAGLSEQPRAVHDRPTQVKIYKSGS